MPNIKSAKKRVEVNERNRAINKAYKSELATGLKKYNKAVSTGDRELVEKLLSETVSLLDKSVTRGIIHKNKADRKKADCLTKLQKMEKPVKKAAKKEPVKAVEAEVKAEEVEVKEVKKTTRKTTTKTAKTEEEAPKKAAAKKTTTAKKTTKKAE